MMLLHSQEHSHAALHVQRPKGARKKVSKRVEINPSAKAIGKGARSRNQHNLASANFRASTSKAPNQLEAFENSLRQ